MGRRALVSSWQEPMLAHLTFIVTFLNPTWRKGASSTTPFCVSVRQRKPLRRKEGGVMRFKSSSGLPFRLDFVLLQAASSFNAFPLYFPSLFILLSSSFIFSSFSSSLLSIPLWLFQSMKGPIEGEPLQSNRSTPNRLDSRGTHSERKFRCWRTSHWRYRERIRFELFSAPSFYFLFDFLAFSLSAFLL